MADASGVGRFLASSSMRPSVLVVALAPLVVFSTLARTLPARLVGLAAATAVLVTMGTQLLARTGWPPRVLDVVQTVVLVVVAVASAVLGHAGDTWLRTWGGAGAGLVVGLVVVALARTRPFTQPLTRAVTPQAYWSAPTFLEINRYLSLVWGLAISAAGLSRLGAAALSDSGSGVVTEPLLGLVVPLALLAIAFVVSKNRYYPIVHRKDV
jgi:hypothetical protein